MDNLSWGLQISALGMGLVFALLALLWGLLTLVLALDRPPEEHAPMQTPGTGAHDLAALSDGLAADHARPSGIESDLPADRVAAILVATLLHKSTLRRQAAPFTRSHWTGSPAPESGWQITGRARQNTTWQPRGK